MLRLRHGQSEWAVGLCPLAFLRLGTSQPRNVDSLRGSAGLTTSTTIACCAKPVQSRLGFQELPFGQERVCPSPPGAISTLRFEATYASDKIQCNCVRIPPSHPTAHSLQRDAHISIHIIRHLPLRTRARSYAKPYSPETGHLACSPHPHCLPPCSPETGNMSWPTARTCSFPDSPVTLRANSYTPLPHLTWRHRQPRGGSGLVGLKYERAAQPARYAPASCFQSRFAVLTPLLVKKGRKRSDDETYGLWRDA
jgi:hypothetical protein